MGANTIPMPKKSGRTVLGVRIGLDGVSKRSPWHSSYAVQEGHLLPSLQSLLSKRRVYSSHSQRSCFSFPWARSKCRNAHCSPPHGGQKLTRRAAVLGLLRNLRTRVVGIQGVGVVDAARIVGHAGQICDRQTLLVAVYSRENKSTKVNYEWIGEGNDEGTRWE
jgi:hypothetical protein